MSKKNNKILTEKQKSIFDFIQGHILEKGYPPTFREIGKKFDMTGKGAYDHVGALIKKGYVQVEPGKSRAIKIINHISESGEMDKSILIESGIDKYVLGEYTEIIPGNSIKNLFYISRMKIISCPVKDNYEIVFYQSKKKSEIKLFSVRFSTFTNSPTEIELNTPVIDKNSRILARMSSCLGNKNFIEIKLCVDCLKNEYDKAK